jgi:magnesium-transporting ATPase (P-type)
VPADADGACQPANVVGGLRGEAKAEASLSALQQMLKNVARVRRDGQAIEIDAEGLVPGDVVLVEAGNRVPTDGGLYVAATLEIEEAAPTGESTPTLKDSATIVKAVEYGRALYDNLTKYICFQMAGLVGFIATFLGAALFGVLGGIAFGPLLVLWINFAVTAPIAVALGFDRPSPGLMARPLRPLDQPVLTRGQWLLCIAVAAAVLVVDEVIKLGLRWRLRAAPAAA